jgi:hypothetical protein
MSALSGDVTIPKVGKLPKVAVAAGVGGVLVLIVYENRKKAAAAAAAPDPNAIDPATNLPYGDATGGAGGYYGGGSGSATGLQTSASYPWDGTYNNTSDPYSMDSATGQTYGAEGYSGSVSSYGGGTGGPPFSTNAQWAQYVLTYFSGSDSLAALTDAIGLYLNGATVTAAQQGLINDATAIGGTPPVSGPGGYPPSIRTAGSTAGGTGVTGGGPVASVSGGHVVSVSNNDAVVAWSATGATQFAVTIHGPGPLNGRTNTVPVTQAVYSGLEAGHNYSVSVQPLVNGKPSGRAGNIDFQTTKGK